MDRRRNHREDEPDLLEVSVTGEPDPVTGYVIDLGQLFPGFLERHAAYAGENVDAVGWQTELHHDVGFRKIGLQQLDQNVAKIIDHVS